MKRTIFYAILLSAVACSPAPADDSVFNEKFCEDLRHGAEVMMEVRQGGMSYEKAKGFFVYGDGSATDALIEEQLRSAYSVSLAVSDKAKANKIDRFATRWYSECRKMINSGEFK